MSWRGLLELSGVSLGGPPVTAAGFRSWLFTPHVGGTTTAVAQGGFNSWLLTLHISGGPTVPVTQGGFRSWEFTPGIDGRPPVSVELGGFHNFLFTLGITGGLEEVEEEEVDVSDRDGAGTWRDLHRITGLRSHLLPTTRRPRFRRDWRR